MKPNVIALASDAIFFPAAAFVADRLAKLNPRDDTEIVIFSQDGAELEKGRQFGVPAEMEHFTLSVKLPRGVGKRITRATFLRLFIPQLLDKGVRRILYLDADIYPENASLFRLFDIDMQGHAMAAVRDVYFAHCHSKETVDEPKKAGVRPDQYLNAGVLLIDRRAYIDSKLGERAHDAVIRRQMHDQQAFNHVLQGDWLNLSPAMNMIVRVGTSFVSKVTPPAITHFLGDVKPWHGPRFSLAHPARKEIESYIFKSPWKEFLAKHYNFQMAWDVLQARKGGPTHSSPRWPTMFNMPKGSDIPAIVAYLKGTQFADVEQGITPIDLSILDNLPKSVMDMSGKDEFAEHFELGNNVMS